MQPRSRAAIPELSRLLSLVEVRKLTCLMEVKLGIQRVLINLPVRWTKAHLRKPASVGLGWPVHQKGISSAPLFLRSLMLDTGNV